MRRWNRAITRFLPFFRWVTSAASPQTFEPNFSTIGIQVAQSLNAPVLLFYALA